jgi:hypothetical protein
MLMDAPRSYGGRHAHMEAIIYVISGEGYTEMDGEHVPWRAGSTYHISGPQVPHQHFNTGTEPSVLLRIASGIRYFFEKVASRRKTSLAPSHTTLLKSGSKCPGGGIWASASSTVEIFSRISGVSKPRSLRVVLR